MAIASKLSGLTPEEKISHERERNRKKSAALRARKKEASTREKAEEGGSSGSSSSGRGGGRKAEVSVSGVRGNEAVIGRLVARLAELGEGGDAIGKLMGGGRAQGSSLESRSSRPFSVAPSASKTRGAASARWDGTDALPSGSSLELSRVSSTSRVETSDGTTHFGALMNGSRTSFAPHQSPSAHQTPQIHQLSHLSFPALSAEGIRFALNLSAASPHVPPRYLPSYSYSSFASSLDNYPSIIRPEDDTLEWKWRLFEFHRVSHENRHDPSEGYLFNPQIDAMVASAQLLILKLLAATSTPEQKAKFDARRPLRDQADRNYLEYAEMDPRARHVPEPMMRVHLSRVTRAGLLNLTEVIGKGLDVCVIHGDFWDLTAWSSPQPPWPPFVPEQTLDEMGLESGLGQTLGLKHLWRGATMREIVLKLEQPGWRLPNVPVVATTSTSTSSERTPCFAEKPFWAYWEKGMHMGALKLLVDC